jgi:hypothetical protein
MFFQKVTEMGKVAVPKYVQLSNFKDSVFVLAGQSIAG